MFIVLQSMAIEGRDGLLDTAYSVPYRLYFNKADLILDMEEQLHNWPNDRDATFHVFEAVDTNDGKGLFNLNTERDGVLAFKFHMVMILKFHTSVKERGMRSIEIVTEW